MTYDELLEKIIGMSKKHAEWVLLLDDLLTDKTKALRAVVELHKPYESADMGMCCQFCTDGKAKEYWYPCSTIQAIKKELG